MLSTDLQILDSVSGLNLIQLLLLGCIVAKNFISDRDKRTTEMLDKIALKQEVSDAAVMSKIDGVLNMFHAQQDTIHKHTTRLDVLDTKATESAKDYARFEQRLHSLELLLNNNRRPPQ